METVAPEYNLDISGAKRLEERIELLGSDDDVMVDLGGVAFLASSGLRILLKQAQRLKAAGWELKICGPSVVVRSVFTMSGFDSIISISDEC